LFLTIYLPLFLTSTFSFFSLTHYPQDIPFFCVLAYGVNVLLGKLRMIYVTFISKEKKNFKWAIRWWTDYKHN
jgi:hypothetical protein